MKTITQYKEYTDNVFNKFIERHIVPQMTTICVDGKFIEIRLDLWNAIGM